MKLLQVGDLIANQTRKRSHYIGVWLNENEYSRLKKDCEISGLSVSSVVRKMIAGTQLRPRPPDQYAALLRELSAIGNNINQIAFWANAQKSVREAEIVDAAVLTRKAWELVKNGLFAPAWTIESGMR